MPMTAPMPMTMPRLVSAERPLWISSAASATRMAERKPILHFLLSRDPEGRSAPLRVAAKLVAGDTAVAHGHHAGSVGGHVVLVRHHDDRLAVLAATAVTLGPPIGAGL